MIYKIINPVVNKDMLDKIVISGSYNKDLVYNSNNWAICLQKYLVLTHLKYKKNALSVYMSRYYWIKKFYHNYSFANGIDAGIEQQIVQLIEEICNNIKDPDFDWNVFEQIHNKVVNEGYTDIL